MKLNIILVEGLHSFDLTYEYQHLCIIRDSNAGILNKEIH